LRDGEPIGVMILARARAAPLKPTPFLQTSEPLPFSGREIEIIRTFADQTAIAIQNARLFDELQVRTRDLSESLQQQTATSGVLKVISRSTFDLQAVLETLTASAARLCDADMAGITRQKEDGALYYATAQGFPAGVEAYLKSVPHPRGSGSVNGRVLLSGRTVHLPDVLADAGYGHLEMQRQANYRTTLGVPLLREGKPCNLDAAG
jgi:GAF domain-containing protein